MIREQLRREDLEDTLTVHAFRRDELKRPAPVRDRRVHGLRAFDASAEGVNDLAALVEDDGARLPVVVHDPEEAVLPLKVEELKELGMSAAELARRIDVPTNRVTSILNAQRAITGDTALRARTLERSVP